MTESRGETPEHDASKAAETARGHTAALRRHGGGLVRWVGFGVSILLIVGVLATAPLREIWRTLTQVNPLYFGLAVVCIVGNLWLRGGRWARLFGSDSNVAWRHAGPLVMIGLAINAVMPGRVGELARIGLAARRFGCGVVVSASTVAIERLLDGATLLLILGGSLLLLPSLSESASAEFLGYEVSGAMITGALRGLAVVCLVLLIGVIVMATRHTHLVVARVVRLIPGIGEALAGRVGNVFERVYTTLGTLRRPGSLAVLMGFSVVIWMLMAIGNYLVTWGVPGIDLSFTQVLVLTAITIGASSIPSAPGAWGVFEASGLLTLVLLGVEFERADGVAYMLALHLSHYLPVIACGWLAAVGENVSVRKIQQAATLSAQQQSTTDTPKRET